MVTKKQKKYLIIGLGNSLMGDDGVGNYIVARLSQYSIPKHIKIVDCGPDILKVLSHFKNQDNIIFIDAMDRHRIPGTIFRLTKSELLKFSGKSKSAHFISVLDAIQLLDKINSVFHKAKIEFIGIQPEIIKINERLSKSVKLSAETVIESLKKQLSLLPDN